MSERHSRPFWNAIHELRCEGNTWAEIEARCLRARSRTWFRKLYLAQDPWIENPPTKAALTGLALAFRCSVRRVQEMISLEWFGCEAANISNLAKVFAITFDDLDEAAQREVAICLASHFFAQRPPSVPGTDAST